MRYCFLTKKFASIDTGTQASALINREHIIDWQTLFEKVCEYKKKIHALVGTGQPLVIYGHKEHEFVIAIIAAHSLSIPFVPIDRAYPDARLQEIQKQLGKGLLYDLTSSQPQIISFDFGDSGLSSHSELAYIMFTSGSTGKPKGVPIGNQAFFNFANWVQHHCGFTVDSVILNQALFSFDVSIFDMVSALSSGGALLMADSSFIEHPETFIPFLRHHRCSDWSSTPSFATRWLLSNEFNQAGLPFLKRFIFIGEALQKSLIRNLHTRFGEEAVWNAYGPTESTVVVTFECMKPALLEHLEGEVTIGKAIPNARLFIIDEKNTVIEQDNSLGEIVIQSDTLADGYLDLTLVANNAYYKAANGRSCYKTGDIGISKKGYLLYRGRKDSQIKLNGYRIELDEIADTLLKLPKVLHSEVIPLVRGDKVIRLVGVMFYNLNNLPETYNVEVIKSKIAERLPYYMIPSEVIAIDINKAPYTHNQKVDKKALLALYMSSEINNIKIGQ